MATARGRAGAWVGLCLASGLLSPGQIRAAAIALLLLAVLGHPALAVDRVWDGEGLTTAWSNNLNWSGDTVPGAADVAIFDATSSKDAVITANINVAGVSIRAGYGGTITQNAGRSITVGAAGFDQAAGTFAGGTSTIDINGPWTLSGGSFTATSGTLAVSGNLTVSGGSFSPGAGTAQFDGTQTIAADGVVFNKVTITSASTHTITPGTTITAAGTLTLSNGYISGGTLAAQAAISQVSGFDGGTGTLLINGAGDQTFTGASTTTTGTLPDVVIDKPGGVLTLAGTIRTTNDWTYVGGALDPGTSLLVFGGTLAVSGSHTLKLVQIRGATTVAAGTTLTVDSTLTMPSAVAFAVNGGVIVNRTLTLTDGSIAGSGAVEARADIAHAATFDGGLGTLLINGPGDQLFTSASTTTTGDLPHIRIDKPGGTLSLAGTLRLVTADWTYMAGNLATAGSALVFEGTVNISGSHALDLVTFRGTGAKTLAAGTNLTVTGDLTLTDGSIAGEGEVAAQANIAQAAAFDGGDGTLRICGAGDQTLTGACTATTGALPDVVIDKPGGTLTLAGTIRTINDWSYLAGTLDAGASTIVFGGTLAVTGSHELTLVEIRGAATVAAGTTLTVKNTLTMPSAVAFTVDGSVIATSTLILTDGSIAGVGAVEARADITHAATFDGGLGTLLINGTGDQTFTSASTTTTGDLPHIRIDKPAGTLSLVGTLRIVAADWTYVAGGLAPGASRVIFDGTVNISGSQTLNLVTLQGIGAKTLGPGTILTVPNTLTLTGGSIDGEGEVRAQAGITQAAAFDGGAGTLRICGAGDQTLTGASTSTTGSLCDLVIEKPSGTLTLAGTIRTTNDWTYSAGAVALGTSAVIFAGNAVVTGTQTLRAVQVRGDVTVPAGTTLTVNNGLTVNTAGALTVDGVAISTSTLTLTNGAINGPGRVEARANITQSADFDGGAGTLRINGTGDQTFTGSATLTEGSLPVVEIAKPSNTLTLAGTIRVQGSAWRRLSGTVASGTSRLVLSSGATVSGSHQLYNLDLEGDGVKTVEAGTTLTATRTLTLGGGTIDGGALVATGDVVQLPAFLGGTTLLTISGAAAQTLTGGGSLTEGSLPSLTILKTGGALTLSGIIRTERDWTYGSGAVNADTSLVVLGGTVNLAAAGMAFNDLRLDATAVTLATALDVDDDFALCDGVLVTAGNAVMIGGDWSQTGGTLVPGAAAVTFNGGLDAEIASAGLGAGARFSDLIIQKSGGAAVRALDDLCVGGDLRLTTGRLDGADRRIVLAGDWLNDAGPSAFAAGTGAVELNGGGQLIGGAHPTTFHALALGGSGAKSAARDLAVVDLTLDQDLLIAPHLLRISGETAGSADVVGTVRRTVSGDGPFSLGSAHTTITFDGVGTNPDSLDVTLTRGVPPVGLPDAVRRYYDIAAAGGEGWTATLRLHYRPDELNGNAEDGLAVWRLAGVWERLGRSGHHYDQNWIERSGVAQFSRWALACGYPDHFEIDPIPSPQTAGVPFPLTVTAVDSSGVRLAEYTGDLSLATTAGSITPAMITMTAADSGRISHSVRVTEAGADQIIRADDGEGHLGQSNPFTVAPSPLRHFSIRPIASPQTAGVPFGVTIAALDSFANRITTFVGTLTLTASAGGVSGGRIDMTAADSGLVTRQIMVGRAEHDLVLTASDGHGHAGVTNAFTVLPAITRRFAIRSIPSPQTAGEFFDLEITAEDAYGNVTPDFTGGVDLATSAGSITPRRVIFSVTDWGRHIEPACVTLAGLGHTVSASDTSGHRGTSRPFDVAGAPLHHYDLAPIDSPQTAGVPFEIAIRALDRFGNLSPEIPGTLALATTAGTIIPATARFSAADSGRHREGVTVTAAGTGRTIELVDSLGRAATSNAFDVQAGGVTRFAVRAIPSPQTAGVAFDIALEALDAQGNLAVGFAGEVALATTAGTITPAAVVFAPSDRGTRALSVQVTQAGMGHVIAATDAAGHSGVSGPFSVTPGVLARFALADVASPQVAGAAFDLVLTAEDSWGNRVTSFAGDVALVTTAGTITPALATFAGADSGRHSAAVWVTLAADGRTITASDGAGHSGASAPFTVTAGPPARLAFVQQPGNGRSGAPLSPQPVVALEDLFGNRTSQVVAIVTMALAGGAAGLPGGTATVVTEDGVAAFRDLQIDRAGAGQRLIASSPDLAPVLSAEFDVEPGPAARLIFLVQPGAGEGGSALDPQPVLAVHDAAGNLAATSTAVIRLALADPPVPAVLSGSSSRAANAGVAAFEDLSIDRSASGYRLMASSEGLVEAVSEPFTVRVGPEVALVFITQPGPAISEQPLAPQPVVEIRDAGGNRATVTVAVTVSLGDHPAGATLEGCTVVTATDGVAAFPGLIIARAAEGYTLRAASPGLMPALSASFGVAAGPPVELVYIEQPSHGFGGEPLERQPAIGIADEAGNPTAADGVEVRLGLEGGDRAGRLLGASAARSRVGLVRFHGLRIDRKGRGYVLAARSDGLRETASAPFEIIPGRPAAITAFGGEDQRGTAGLPLAEPLLARLADAGDNPLAGVRVRFAVTSSPRWSSGQGLSDPLVATDSAGVAAVRLTLGSHAGAYQVTATSPDLPGHAVVFSASAREPDGTGAVTIVPMEVFAGADVDIAFTLQADERATNTEVAIEWPIAWRWSGRAADLELSGDGFLGAQSSVSGSGSAHDPFVLTVTRARVAPRRLGTLTVRATTAPEETRGFDFRVSTASHSGCLTPLAHQPSVQVGPLVAGDATLDGLVDLLDLLSLSDFIQGRGGDLGTAQRRAADVFPAHAAAPRAGPPDGRLERADIELLERAILNQVWDDGLALGRGGAPAPPGVSGEAMRAGGEAMRAGGEAMPAGGGDFSAAGGDLTLIAEAAAGGATALRMTNGVPVRGIQIDLRPQAGGPLELRCRGFDRVDGFRLVSAIAHGEHRILLWSPGDALIASGAGHVLWVDATPSLYNFAASSAVGAAADNRPLSLTLRAGGDDDLPKAFRLDQARPNPFRETATISFAVPRFAPVTIEIFDVAGRLVRRLHAGETDPGYHRIVWAGTDDAGQRLFGGLYWCRLTSGGFTATQRIMLLD